MIPRDPPPGFRSVHYPPKVLSRAANPLEGLLLLRVCRETRDIIEKTYDLLPEDTDKASLKLRYPLHVHPTDILHFNKPTHLVNFVGRTAAYKPRNKCPQCIAVNVTTKSNDRYPKLESTQWKLMDVAHSVEALSGLKKCIVVENENYLKKDCEGDFMDRLMAYGKELVEEAEEKSRSSKLPNFTLISEDQFEKLIV